MARTLLIRMASAAAVVSLAVLFVAFIPFLIAEPSGANGSGRAPATSINRMLKGDRLPLAPNMDSEFSGGEPQQQLKPQRRLPVGCEGAFSPISAPALAHVYGRCTT